MRLLRCLSFVLLAVASASPLLSRADKLSAKAGVALVQWQTGSTNNLRSYHIDKSGNIIESSYVPGAQSSSWVDNTLSFVAYPNGKLTAAVRKYSENTNDVEIRLVFEDSGGYMLRGARYTPQLGWQSDDNLNQAGIVGRPLSLITFKDAQNTQQWRLYYAVYGDDIGSNMRIAHYKQASLSDSTASSSWATQTVTTTWVSRNGPAAATAVAWDNGNRISLLYWRADFTEDAVRPGGIEEARWSPGSGWTLYGWPTLGWDWRNFAPEGSLAAAGWRDDLGVDQIRLYVRWRDPLQLWKVRLVEFSAGASGWSSTKSDDFDDYAVDGTEGLSPMSAVAWAFPANKPHIRIHYSACPGSFSDGCDARIKEVKYDEGDGWSAGPIIDS